MTNLKRLLIIITSCTIMMSAAACTTDNSTVNNNPETITTTESNTAAQVENSTENTSQVRNNNTASPSVAITFDPTAIPEYSGEPYIEVNCNIPYFTDEILEQVKNTVSNESYMFENGDEKYLPLDELQRCQTATGLLSKDTMPPEGEERSGIGMIKPAGWHTVKYPDVISDLYLYNRCHLIGWQLGSENANEMNLTTGTRYMNVEGMLPFENKTADYIESTDNHVLYRVTPVFIDNELICRGVLMEAQSIEDDGLNFCVYCYNVQPYIRIDYTTGESVQIDESIDSESANIVGEGDKIPKQNLV